MADIKVMSAGAVKTMVTALGAEFERESGNKLNLNFGTAGSLRERIKNGEVSDLVVLSESAIAELAKLGLVVPGSSADLGRTVTGVIVREGAPEPDISTPDAFKQALLDARSVAYTDPKAGGSGGIMFSALLQKLGIADEVNKKAVLGKGGHDVAVVGCRRSRRAWDHLYQRSPAGAGRQGGWSVARPPAHRQYLHSGNSYERRLARGGGSPAAQAYRPGDARPLYGGRAGAGILISCHLARRKRPA